MTQYFTTADGIRLAYQEQGQGPALICLSGLTRNMADFEFFLESTDIDARIICMTYRGRMPSDYDPNWENYNVAKEAEDILALMDHLNVPSATILGSSRGGLIAMMIAMTAPDRLNGAILNDIGPELSRDGLERIAQELQYDPKWASLEAAALDLKTRHQGEFPDLDDETWRRIAAARYDFTANPPQKNYDQNLAKHFETLPDELSFWPFFEALTARPLGLIWGKNSDLLRAETVEKMQATAPKMHLAALADRGHIPLLNEPDALSAIKAVFEEANQG